IDTLWSSELGYERINFLHNSLVKFNLNQLNIKSLEKIEQKLEGATASNKPFYLWLITFFNDTSPEYQVFNQYVQEFLSILQNNKGRRNRSRELDQLEKQVHLHCLRYLLSDDVDTCTASLIAQANII